MRQIVLDESMEDMDKNKDGFVSINEYVGQYVCMCARGCACVCVCTVV